MRIVITGASGNVGTAVVRRLTAEGHDLVGVVRRPPEPGASPLDDVTWIAADLALDHAAPVLREAMTGADAVVHLAWAFQPSHHPDLLKEVGVGGTDRVLTAALQCGVPQVVHMSSVGAYSPKQSDVPVQEDYPTGGIDSSMYSRHKAAAERLLDRFEADHPDVVVTRLRPGIIGQRAAGSALLRYGLPALIPAPAVKLLPILPMDRAVLLPLVHADDVADAVARALSRRVGGAFNLCADRVVTVEDLAGALGARHVQTPLSVVRALVSATWHAGLQPLDAGWIDLAVNVPLMDCSRAHDELGWVPAHDAVSTLQAMVDGMAGADSFPTPALRPRTWADSAAHLSAEGVVTHRRHT